LSELANEVASTVERSPTRHQVELRVQAVEPVAIEGNGTHLRRLLVNLLDNALKFSLLRE